MSIKSTLRNYTIILNGLFRKDYRSRVIFYHDVYDRKKYTEMGTSLLLFENHIKIIKQLGFEIVPHITKSHKEVQICFDDGFRGVWDCSQFFIDNDIHPTIFISDSLIGQPEYLTVREIKELYRKGFLFEGHGRSHTDLTKFSSADLYTELSESLNYLRSVTGINIKDLCFPQGFYSDNVVQTALECGYKRLYVSDPQPYDGNPNIKLVPRYLVQWSSKNALSAILSGGADFLYTHYINYHKQ